MTKGQRTVVSLVAVLAVLSCGLLGACQRKPEAAHQQPVEDRATNAGSEAGQTSDDPLEVATGIISRYTKEYGEPPPREWGQHLLTEWQEVRDQWGMHLRYTLGSDGQFEIQSAGPDRAFDTADDLLDRESTARRELAQRDEQATAEIPAEHVPSAAADSGPSATRSDEPYELKGDWLGMALRDFKAKHTRSIPDHDKDAPWCSDAPGLTDDAIVMLLAEPWYGDAQMVNCRITFPFEDLRGEATTVAGVETDLLVYHFVDEQLFRITARFPHAGYEHVKAALIAKYGQPDAESTELFQNAFGATFRGEVLTWANAVSTITLTERALRLDISLLVFAHRELEAIAWERRPTPADDDL